MDKPIGVGDLVMVVRPGKCTKCPAGFGRIGTVAKIRKARSRWSCTGCGSDFKKSRSDNYFVVELECGRSYQSWRLKRIDPPAIPESTRTEEALKEPA